MIQLARVILFTALMIAGVSCLGQTLGDLPSETKQQIQGILEKNVGFHINADCKHRLRSNVQFLLYTQNNQDSPITLNIANPKQLDPSKKIIILIHGWLSGSTTSGIVKIKDAYLKRYDCNVIVVDWSKAASLSYDAAYCHVQSVAQYIAKALCFLKNKLDISLENLHVVGHSFGAHIAGWVGKYASTKCLSRIGRITGLDPAGTNFNTLPENRRLEKTDALFVDVIHTDGDKFGFTFKAGHSDFYPNCGISQPGCPNVKELGLTNSTLLSDVFCSHHRSMEYMAESINHNHFVAVSCGLCPRYCRAEILSEVYRMMGEDCKHESGFYRSFYIPTKSSPPYYEGWDAYPGVSHKFA